MTIPIPMKKAVLDTAQAAVDEAIAKWRARTPSSGCAL
jgi:hypothetical protein